MKKKSLVSIGAVTIFIVVIIVIFATLPPNDTKDENNELNSMIFSEYGVLPKNWAEVDYNSIFDCGYYDLNKNDSKTTLGNNNGSSITFDAKGNFIYQSEDFASAIGELKLVIDDSSYNTLLDPQINDAEIYEFPFEEAIQTITTFSSSLNLCLDYPFCVFTIKANDDSSHQLTDLYKRVGDAYLFAFPILVDDSPLSVQSVYVEDTLFSRSIVFALVNKTGVRYFEVEGAISISDVLASDRKGISVSELQSLITAVEENEDSKLGESFVFTSQYLQDMNQDIDDTRVLKPVWMVFEDTGLKYMFDGFTGQRIKYKTVTEK